MKMLLLASAATLASLALGGCVTATEYAAQVAVADDGDCRSYGAEPGSQAYLQCRMTKSQSHEYAAPPSSNMLATKLTGVWRL